jgi:peptidoglycan L-alanyl-D-glutamate endopeptidase CwlK
MPAYSKTSRERLLTCHEDIQRVFFAVIQVWDCKILCGHRGMEEQNEAVRIGASKLSFPMSNHNVSPSDAVDVVPCPVDWVKWGKDKKELEEFAKVVKAEAKKLNIELVWGGDWKTFKDYPHWERSKVRT